MAQIASQRQGTLGKGNKWIEIVAVAFIVVAVALAVVAAFAAAPKAVAPSKTTMQYMQEPGLLDQRAGERGGAQITTPGASVVNPLMTSSGWRCFCTGLLTQPGGSLLSPSMQAQRKGERGVVEATQSAGNRLTPQLEERKIRERATSSTFTMPDRVLISESLQEQRREQGAGATSDSAIKDAKIHRHLRGHSAGRSSPSRNPQRGRPVGGPAVFACPGVFGGFTAADLRRAA
jgi:hypothetical protein